MYLYMVLSILMELVLIMLILHLVLLIEKNLKNEITLKGGSNMISKREQDLLDYIEELEEKIEELEIKIVGLEEYKDAYLEELVDAVNYIVTEKRI